TRRGRPDGIVGRSGTEPRARGRIGGHGREQRNRDDGRGHEYDGAAKARSQGSSSSSASRHGKARNRTNGSVGPGYRRAVPSLTLSDSRRRGRSRRSGRKRRKRRSAAPL